MEREEKQFVNGLAAYRPFDTAPQFVKGSLVMFRDDLIEWLKTQPERINLDLKESKAGKYYVEVSTYKKQSMAEQTIARENKQIGAPEKLPEIAYPEASLDDILDMPF